LGEFFVPVLNSLGSDAQELLSVHYLRTDSYLAGDYHIDVYEAWFVWGNWILRMERGTGEYGISTAPGKLTKEDLLKELGEY